MSNYKYFPRIKEVVDLDKVVLGTDLDFMSELGTAVTNVLQDYNISGTNISVFLDIFEDDNLSVTYFVEHSAEKIISPYFARLLDMEERSVITAYTRKSGIAKTVARKFALSWYKVFDALLTNYKPLENYSMVESVAKHDTSEVYSTDTDNGTVNHNTDISTSTNSETGIYGFNSLTDSQPTGTGTGTQTTTGDDDTNFDSHTNTKTGQSSVTDNGTENRSRSGNIGVTTSQQMLESEIKIRLYDFIESMLNDIDKVTCLAVY